MSTPINTDGSSFEATALDRGFFGHPRGLSTLFFTEMWERFSYYGMRAILTLYMTKNLAEGGLGFDEKYAAIIYATYVSSVWYLPLIGHRHRLWPLLDGHQHAPQLLRGSDIDRFGHRAS
jgi:hypothetical protein